MQNCSFYLGWRLFLGRGDRCGNFSALLQQKALQLINYKRHKKISMYTNCCLRKQSDLLCFGSIRTAEMHFSFFKTPCLCGLKHQKIIRQKVVHLNDRVPQNRHSNTVHAAAKTTAVNYTFSENPNNHWQTGQHRIFSLSSQDCM